jgi:hypothetical protein
MPISSGASIFIRTSQGLNIAATWGHEPEAPPIFAGADAGDGQLFDLIHLPFMRGERHQAPVAPGLALG